MPVAERRRVADNLASGQQSLAAFVEDLSRRPESLHYAPIVLFPWESQRPAFAFETGMQLVTAFTAGDREIFHIAAKPPCDPKLAEKVRPWWAPTTEVFVCPEAHRPDVLRSPEGRVCPNQDPACPCGPNLMACAPEDVFEAVRRSIRAEFNDTIVTRISEKGTLADLFRGQETVRDRYAEWVYRRAQVQRGAALETLLHINDWPELPTRAPRPELGEGIHSGVLTTPHVQSMLFDRRERMQVMSDLLWCLEPRSVHVVADKVLSLPVEFRALDGWAQLAHMPVCDSCHARLDYGTQFWLSWESGGRYDAKAKPQPTMKFYMRDQHDLRGEGVTNPAAFAELAVAQPEFGRCMSKRVVDHVLGGAQEPVDFAAVNEAYSKAGTYQALMSAALLRLADHLLAPRDAPAAVQLDLQANQAAAPHGMITPSPALKELLDDECVSCHAGPEAPLGVRFDVAAIDRPRLAKALEEVAFGRMPPPDEELSVKRRRGIVQQLVSHLWSDGKAQTIALRYFNREANNVNIHRPDSILRQIRARVGLGTTPADVSKVDLYLSSARRDQLEYTPEMALSTVLFALDACKEAGEATDECLVNAAALEGVVLTE